VLKDAVNQLRQLVGGNSGSVETPAAAPAATAHAKSAKPARAKTLAAAQHR
jgi:hypothetical protein